ncbi:actin-related protein 3 [Platysternon megacephalum]|uniref:Actin-related protein 3 n=1 Tax=Platysternon megacephalum TaxID=55544 RepID=A0A4D9ERI4_9SAUR|nr:actin-related protein 3 [Platysternon megacephalum]
MPWEFSFEESRLGANEMLDSELHVGAPGSYARSLQLHRLERQHGKRRQPHPERAQTPRAGAPAGRGRAQLKMTTSQESNWRLRLSVSLARSWRSCIAQREGIHCSLVQAANEVQ